MMRRSSGGITQALQAKSNPSGGPSGARARTRCAARPPRSTLRFAAGAGVEAEAVRELARGLQHERRDLLLDALRGEPKRRCSDGDRTDDVARVVADRRGDGADLLQMLADVDGVAARRDRAQLLEEGLAVDDRLVGAAREAVGEE